jgi:hypothetical protein
LKNFADLFPTPFQGTQSARDGEGEPSVFEDLRYCLLFDFAVLARQRDHGHSRGVSADGHHLGQDRQRNLSLRF